MTKRLDITEAQVKCYIAVAKENAAKDPHYVRDMERALDFLESELSLVKEAVKAADQLPS